MSVASHVLDLTELLARSPAGAIAAQIIQRAIPGLPDPDADLFALPE